MMILPSGHVPQASCSVHHESAKGDKEEDGLAENIAAKQSRAVTYIKCNPSLRKIVTILAYYA